MNFYYYFCKKISQKIKEYYINLNKWYIKHSISMFNIHIKWCVKLINNKCFFNSSEGKTTIYKYRFKTIDEFENEFGENWRKDVKFTFVECMDFLLGEDFVYNENEIENGLIDFDYIVNDNIEILSLYISYDMLIKNDGDVFKKLYLENKNVYD